MAKTLLEHPEAQALLGDADLPAAAVAACADRLTAFARRYLPHFYRAEQRDHALTVLRGKLTGLPRKTTKPIATQAGQQRRPLQLFVGAGAWDDHAVRAELRRHVRQELADERAVLVLDNHGVPKKGNDSCGVGRQWCGRLGKVDNCQVGYFLAYAAPRGKALLDCQLFLPPERADDREHRAKTYVPKDVCHREGWRLALELVRGAGKELPHGWVSGDDEFGRATEFRAALRLDGERYVLDVPCNTSVRDLSGRRPPSRPGARPRLPRFERADAWAARQPRGRWRKFRVGDGEKGPRQVRALQQWVQTKDRDGCAGPRERLVVMRSCERKPRTWYTLSNARREVPLAQVVAAHGEHHGVEELFQEGSQEVGLNQYEVRSWVGWRHHMTLTLLALWFLQLQKLRLGEKRAADHGVPGAGDLHGAAGQAAAERARDRGAGERDAAA
jgi:SRSO17 transposase